MPIYKDGNKRKDGKQHYNVRVNYTDAQGKHRSYTRSAYGSQEAKQLEMALMAQQKGPSHAETVRTLYQKYYNDKQHELRETSLDKLRAHFECHILPFLGDTPVKKITSATMQNWKSYINEKELAVSTKQNIYAALSGFMTWAVQSSYFEKNPLKNISNFRDAYAKPKKDTINYYTPPEFKLYNQTCTDIDTKVMNYNYHLFFLIAFYTGMRKGEINALKWSDIKDGKIHVTRSISQKLKGEYRETPPKNKSSNRVIQCPKTLLVALECQLSRHKQITQDTQEMRVCGGTGVLSDSGIDKYNRKISQLANLPRIRVHDFRHSHASLLANNGINIQEIARRLGHSNVQETWNTYSHLYPQEEERALAVLDSI